LFIVPDLKDLDAASAVGADAVELHTGAYAECWKGAQTGSGLSDQLGRLRRAAAHGRSLGLAVHAGHGLTYENVTPVAAIAEIEELNIGHSIVSRAVLVGIERAVSEMKAIVTRARDARAG
jgi:pyridoxine 5-phosphate synthase